MHGECFRRHVALGIDVAVKALPRRHTVVDLDAADLDQPVAAQRIEACGFGVENDFAHGYPEDRSFGESGPPLRHFNDLGQNVADSCAYRVQPVRRIHYEIRAPAFFGVRQLPRQNGVERL